MTATIIAEVFVQHITHKCLNNDSICFVHRELGQLDLEASREGKESRAACMFEL